MKIRFQCAQCGKVLKAGREHVGRKARCTRCGTPVVVPEPPEEPEVWRAPDGDEPPPSAAEDDDGPLVFERRIRDEGDLDMTSMVDVVFLLLIFFMVTAAFSLQKAIAVPTPDPTEGASRSRTIEEIETEGDFVIVRIDKDDTVWVDGIYAPSEQELLAKLRDARQSGDGGRGPNQMLVMASPEAMTETVIMALDAGSAVGMEDVRLANAEDEP